MIKLENYVYVKSTLKIKLNIISSEAQNFWLFILCSSTTITNSCNYWLHHIAFLHEDVLAISELIGYYLRVVYYEIDKDKVLNKISKMWLFFHIDKPCQVVTVIRKRTNPHFKYLHFCIVVLTCININSKIIHICMYIHIIN